MTQEQPVSNSKCRITSTCCLLNHGCSFQISGAYYITAGKRWFLDHSSLLDPPLYSMHFKKCIHYKIAIPYYTNSLGYIRSQQLVNNIQSMVRKKRKETVFGCVKCSKHYFSFICQRPSCSS